ncbi:hypothetical protein L1887_17004 [Cichorium endivia]|nr:hypothetical protein L1887_17004 [Cichorium endivia]
MVVFTQAELSNQSMIDEPRIHRQYKAKVLAETVPRVLIRIVLGEENGGFKRSGVGGENVERSRAKWEEELLSLNSEVIVKLNENMTRG